MPIFRATPEQIEEYIRRAGATAGPSVAEARASCKLDGETQIAKYRCACGWSGIPDVATHPQGIGICPKCGASGGLILAVKPKQPRKKAPMQTLSVTLFQSICERSGLPVPQPEVQFCAGRKWRVDWLFEWITIDLMDSARLALEIDGAVHRIKDKWKRDFERHRALLMQGIWLLRVMPAEFADGTAVALVREWAEKRGLI